MRPGVPGWAQITSRNAVPWDEPLAMDVRYVENHSIAHDLRILWRTVNVVARRDGMSGAGSETMQELRP